MMRDENGFTLAEVMIAFVILLMASQLLISGFAVSQKMERRANELSGAADLLKENILDDSKCMFGTLRMKIDEDIEFVHGGWLYQNEALSERDYVINAVRIEEEN